MRFAWAARRPVDEEAAQLRDDVRLTAAVAQGDADAKRELVSRLLDRTRRSVHALVRDRIDAADVLQEVVVELLRAAPRYRGDASLAWWADRLTVRYTMRWLQKRRRRWNELSGDRELEQMMAPQAAAPLTERMVRPVEEYLTGLSEPLRVALLLRYGAGHSMQEVAEATGASVKTAEKRVLRALETLRKRIRADRGELPAKTTSKRSS